MGSARHRSWSYTRGKLAAECPRALYFQYYPWGDEKQNIARFLRRAATPESLAGTIVHRQIALGLRQLVRCNSYPADLHLSATREYDAALRESKRLADAVRGGRRPADEGTVLFHHLYGQESPVAEENGRDLIQISLQAFATSEALEFLEGTNFDRWRPILTTTDDVQWFTATADLGFTTSVGLRIYAAYDLVISVGNELLIVDWKTGGDNCHAEAAARRQLAVYTLWAMADGQPPERVRVAGYWLQPNEPWEPTAIPGTRALGRNPVDRGGRSVRARHYSACR